MREEAVFSYMQRALDVAWQGLEKGELPIGAVVVLNDEVIAEAHTMERETGRLLVHAELLALEAVDRLPTLPGKRRDITLFTTSEPCLMCLGAAMSSFIGHIYYGHEMPSDGAVSLVETWQRDTSAFPTYVMPTIQGGILRDEALTLFEQYVERHNSGGMWEWAKTVAALR